MIEKIITYGLIGIAATFTLSFLNKQASKKVAPLDNGKYALRLNSLYQYVGLGSLILGLIGFLLPTILLDSNGWLVGLIFLLIFGILGGICALWYFNHKFIFDSKKIESVSVYGKKTFLEWKDVVSISFNAISGLLVFKGSNGIKVKAHQHLVGLTELTTMMEQKTKWTVKGLKIPLNK
jgi:uncharacterized membrane-anchored protein